MSNLASIPKLTGLLEDPESVSLLPTEAIPALRGQLARLDSLLLMQLFRGGNGQANGQDEDRLLDVNEAAAKLSKSRDALYRNAHKYPFTVRDGRSLRFSSQGIQKYIRQRMGR